jgi:hypothetical protein
MEEIANYTTMVSEHIRRLLSDVHLDATNHSFREGQWTVFEYPSIVHTARLSYEGIYDTTLVVRPTITFIEYLLLATAYLTHCFYKHSIVVVRNRHIPV